MKKKRTKHVSQLLILDSSNFQPIHQVAGLLKAGEVVGFPTETVYGIGALLSCEEAQRRIFEIKGRPAHKLLMAHISSLEMLSDLNIHPSELLLRLAEAFLPGPLAVVLPREEGSTMGIRIPAHPAALALIESVGEPIMATSANLSGQPSSCSAEEVSRTLGGRIAAILDGGSVSGGQASTILSLASDHPFLLREGPISRASLEKVLDLPVR